MVPPRRRLLGRRDLARLIAPPTFEKPHIGPPPVTDAQREHASGPIRLAVDAYRVLERSSIGRVALTTIGPTLMAVARRTGSR
jgi:hypothetical protein